MNNLQTICLLIIFMIFSWMVTPDIRWPKHSTVCILLDQSQELICSKSPYSKIDVYNE